MGFEDWWLNAFWSLAPTLGVGAIFWFIIRSVIHADRNERKAYAKVEQQERERFASAAAAAEPDQVKAAGRQ